MAFSCLTAFPLIFTQLMGSIIFGPTMYVPDTFLDYSISVSPPCTLPAPPFEGLIRWHYQPVPNSVYEGWVILFQMVQTLVDLPPRLWFGVSMIFSFRQFLKCNANDLT